MGSRLLRLPPVKAAVEAALAARADRTRVTADRAIAEYVRLAFADMRRYAEWGENGVKLRARTGDYTNAEQRAARARLKAMIEKIVADRKPGTDPEMEMGDGKPTASNDR